MKDIKSLVESIVAEIQSETPIQPKVNTSQVQPIKVETPDSKTQYPLGKYEADRLKSKSGKAFHDVIYESLIDGEIGHEDIKTHAETLQKQAQVAYHAGKQQLGDNLMRASEMVSIPDDEVLEIYNLLRPNRTDKQTLLDAAKRIRQKYGAEKTAQLIENAAVVYEKRNIVTK